MDPPMLYIEEQIAVYSQRSDAKCLDFNWAFWIYITDSLFPDQ